VKHATPTVGVIVWWIPIILSLVMLNKYILSMLWSVWTSFWYYCSLIDYCVLLSIRYLIYSSSGCLRDAFMSLATFLGDNVTVEFFIYFIFLPITIIPSILLNYAGRYTLSYSKCGGSRNSRTRSWQSGRRGLHLARYHA
jgi:hypothetical protein